MNERVLVLGATGAMGQYLVPELLSLGYRVVGVALERVVSDNPNLKYIQANVKEGNTLSELLADNYDGIVDFMSYNTEEFRAVYPTFLQHTGHYIYLSSCRVYADNPPIREDSPRLLDVSTDKYFLSTDDYALCKARGEDMLRASDFSNWTIVRPATTYSRGRFQLVSLEAETLIHRMLAGKSIVLPESAMDKQATHSWGGDVAKMIARLMFNPFAYRNDYIVSTSEHHTWREIAAIYHEICPFRYIEVSTEDYLDVISECAEWTKYQLLYGRMFTRITDNSKILAHTGLKQSDLMTLKDGLRHEFERSRDFDWEKYASAYRNVRMDEYLKKEGLE